VTTILGFTELGEDSLLYNSAAILNQGAVIGRYRKLHPALNKSVYSPGNDTPVFSVGDLTFGIVICLDSRYPDPARMMAARGATALFIPTNNGMPPSRGGSELVREARQIDVDHAVQNRMWVIRSDVAGRADGLVSYGSSGIIDKNGTMIRIANQLEPALLIVELETEPKRCVDDDTGRSNVPAAMGHTEED
jgi:predicted amidohydrolase